MSNEEYESHEEAVNAYPALIFACVNLTILCVHSYKYYQDFYTKERLSVKHRRSPPNIDRPYVYGGRLTLVTLIFFTLCIVGWAVQYNFIFGKCTASSQVASGIGTFASKAGLYLTYVYRLHQIYGPSAYGYSSKKLSCIGISAVIICIVLFVLYTISAFSFPLPHDDTDGKFPHFCQIEMQEPYSNMVGGGMVLFEVVASALAIWGFTRPLKRVVAAVERTMSVKNVHDATAIEAKKRNEKILYSGYKYKVLVISASVSTFLWIVLFLLGLTSTASVLLLLDYVINPICILLMTPYYPSNLYYERCCCLCICCCDPEKKSYQSKAHSNKSRVSVTGASVKSVDTSRAINHAPDAPSAAEAESNMQSDVQLAVGLNTADSNEVTPEPQGDEPRDEENGNP